MKITMIGHASIYGETQDLKFMMDPVLWDPHQEGLFDVCPKREVILEKIPDFDLLIISHKHLDHFDIRSLAYLPKTVEVFIPKDPLIERCLRKLGYRKIYPLKEFRELKIGSTSLMTTRSENRVPEFGLIFADESGVFWNGVDTILSPETINFVRQRHPSIDFLLATWQPMLECNYQMNQNISFPYDSYGSLLYNISLIDPKAIGPGANAFKYRDGAAWLNQIVFPLTQEKFCQDVLQVCPHLGQNIFPLMPGDVIEFSQGDFKYLVNNCEFVRTIKDNRDTLDFAPVNVGNSLVDDNPKSYDLQLMHTVIEKTITEDLTQFINTHQQSIFYEHSRWNVVYQLEIVFPNGSQKWSFDFSQKEIKAQKGRDPLANFFSYITASGLYGLLQKTRGWDYVGLGGYHRHFQKIYQATPLGLVLPQYSQFTEPITAYFGDENLEVIMRDAELATWEQNQSVTPSSSMNVISKKNLKITHIESEDLLTASGWLKQPSPRVQPIIPLN